MNCQEEFLRTSMYQPAKWDLISFNFGTYVYSGEWDGSGLMYRQGPSVLVLIQPPMCCCD